MTYRKSSVNNISMFQYIVAGCSPIRHTSFYYIYSDISDQDWCGCFSIILNADLHPIMERAHKGKESIWATKLTICFPQASMAHSIKGLGEINKSFAQIAMLLMTFLWTIMLWRPWPCPVRKPHWLRSERSSKWLRSLVSSTNAISNRVDVEIRVGLSWDKG